VLVFSQRTELGYVRQLIAAPGNIGNVLKTA
jgi:hypothetical protein